MWIILKFSNKRFDDFHLMFLILVFLFDIFPCRTHNGSEMDSLVILLSA